MAELLKEFIQTDDENLELFKKYKELNDKGSLDQLKKKYEEYCRAVRFLAYIKYTVRFAAINYVNKENKRKNREILKLNCKEEGFDQDRIDSIQGDDGEHINKIESLDEQGIDFNSLDLDEKMIKSIDNLTIREKQVVYKNIILNKSEKMLAKELNISQQAVNKTKKRALEKLRKSLQ